MKKMNFLIMFVAFVLTLGCSKTEAALETFSALECANLLQKISNDDENQTCAEIIADIDQIEKKCGAFLDQEEKESLAFAKANCEDD